MEREKTAFLRWWDRKKSKSEARQKWALKQQQQKQQPQRQTWRLIENSNQMLASGIRRRRKSKSLQRNPTTISSHKASAHTQIGQDLFISVKQKTLSHHIILYISLTDNLFASSQIQTQFACSLLSDLCANVDFCSFQMFFFHQSSSCVSSAFLLVLPHMVKQQTKFAQSCEWQTTWTLNWFWLKRSQLDRKINIIIIINIISIMIVGLWSSEKRHTNKTTRTAADAYQIGQHQYLMPHCLHGSHAPPGVGSLH